MKHEHNVHSDHDDHKRDNSPYTAEELFRRGPQRSYSHDAREAKFLLGGIGTGNVSVGSRGQLCDWELFNSQGKGNALPYSFFAIRVKAGEGEAVAKVLEAKLTPPFANSHGFFADELAGLPRLDASVLRGEYPFVQVDFTDRFLPVKVAMEAFTPFIPLNPDESGIPGAVIRYRVTNTADQSAEVSIAGSLANAAGYEGRELFHNMRLAGEVRNECRSEQGLQGIFFYSPDLPPKHPRNGTMSLMTRDDGVSMKEEWLPGAWWDGIQEFWTDFSEDGRLEAWKNTQSGTGKLHAGGKERYGSVCIRHTLAPGEERVFEFVLTWHYPNRPKEWQGHILPVGDGIGMERNYYAALFADAWTAGTYLYANMARLEGSSRDFHRALFGSTLPDYVIDALAANITVLRSTTCFRIQDGTLLGWEGGFDHRGSCEGSCTHVWNYAQTLAFLFPSLERTMRRVEFLLETDEEGSMSFRTNKAFGGERWDMVPAADGQLGTIVRLYREWKLSGDDAFLRELWPKARLALDFACRYWDSDGDFVLDSEQHNTYDVEFYGPNTLTNTMFYAALKAGAAMAAHIGDEERSQFYTEAWMRGSAAMDAMLWGGEYYIQRLDDVDAYRYQQGTGCLSDQLIGQFMAHVAGLGYILPEAHVKAAVRSVYRYNFRTDFSQHANVQRTYALGDEKGLLLCSWPRGGRPKFPFIYSDEVWTGIEYQVAAHLIYEDLVEEGLTLVKALRERHDGIRRNPWNEVECGNHYARSMASWALLPAISGYRCDMVGRTMSFSPKLYREDFSCFWSTGTAWGIYKQSSDETTGRTSWDIEVLYGELHEMQVNGKSISQSAKWRE
ncbi:GH116 family glycosyl-hydrolase [Paenibacillus sacheonensis]|uniref:Glucosylceramidase n=1 Tax=Paenibacillus sacheonensis TaxID=742054 RepID=A0A7X4YJS3_9BACL|nr:GH116 family glycosyl-hydrolase [Paenibacillus sacheonensis]MBM7563955.1 uncharacterized protein (DUF608 family) [Paenibacillus sacheonensis]NBC67703.1 hypothetical protein [Paenibacillus sacheonensis]